jgi:hypothetical protein
MDQVGSEENKTLRRSFDDDDSTEPYVLTPAIHEVKEFWIEKPVDTQGGTEVSK